MIHILKCVKTFNIYYATVIFLYPLKTSVNLWLIDVFRGYKERLVAVA